MPYVIKRKGSQWTVVSKGTGHVKGVHETRAEARKQQKAIYANAKKERK